MDLASPKATYLLAPGFSYRRGGKIQLGNFFKDPLKLYDVVLSFVPADDTIPPYDTHIEPEFRDLPDVPTTIPGEADAVGTPPRRLPSRCITLVDRGNQRRSVKGWAKFLETFKLSASHESSKDASIVYLIDKIETAEFTTEGLREYVQARADSDPTLHDWLYARRPAYLVSGVKYSTGLYAEIVRGHNAETDAELAARVNEQLQVGLAAGLGGHRSRERIEAVTGEVVFAYQVTRVWYSDRKMGTVDVETLKLAGALLNGGEGPVDAADEEEEEEARLAALEDQGEHGFAAEAPQQQLNCSVWDGRDHARETGLDFSELGSSIFHLFPEE